jgi:hypothetical protein
LTPTTTVSSSVVTQISGGLVAAGRTYSLRLPDNRRAEIQVPPSPESGWQAISGFGGFSVANDAAGLELSVTVLKDFHIPSSPYLPVSAIQAGTGFRTIPSDVVAYLKSLPITVNATEPVTIGGVTGQTLRFEIGALPSEARTAACFEFESRPCALVHEPRRGHVLGRGFTRRGGDPRPT